jgi:hypothetical protein
MQFRPAFVFFALGSIFSGAAMSQPAAPAENVASQPEANPERVVCRLERPTGSQIPTKICKSAALWELEHEQSRKMMQDAQQRTGSTHAH